MQVNQVFSTNPTQALTSPFRSTNGITLTFRTGDVCHPKGLGKWFEPPYFSEVLRFKTKIPLPFISYRWGDKGGYIGAKVYGADSEAYKNWMKPEDVYEGSQAMHFSMRVWASLK